MRHTLLPFSVFSSIRHFTFIRIFNPCILTIFKHLILYLHSTVITHCYNFLRIFLMTNHWNDLSPPAKKSSVDRFIFNLVYKHVYLFRIFLTVHVKNRNFSPISTRLCLSVCPFKSKGPLNSVMWHHHLNWLTFALPPPQKKCPRLLTLRK